MRSEISSLITLVCYANYCRSPVAEKLLSSYCLEKNFKFVSRGIKKVTYFGMHELSEKYLNIKQINDTSHYSTKINSKDINSSKFIICLDYKVFYSLVNEFNSSTDKIMLLNKFNKDLNIPDPIQMNEENYFKVMNNIEKACISWSKFLIDSE